jgi:hypothetical protein
MIFLLLLAALALQGSPQAPDQTTELLRAKDQMLLDALAPGNQKVWDQALAADAVYVDENGAVMDRDQYLKQLLPLPPGSSGSLQITTYTAHVSGDLATVVHTDDEQENYHGQMLFARYLTTETWRREAGEWKLHLVHAYAVLKDPPAISLPPESMQQYVGRYVAAADLVYVIEWDGKQLMGGRQGRVMQPLKVEVRDVLFVPGEPRIRKIFQRDAAGKIAGFVDRRESLDVGWQRASTGPS